MNGDQKQTLIIAALAFAAGLLMFALGGCSPESQPRSIPYDAAVGWDPMHTPSRGPGNISSNITTEDALRPEDVTKMPADSMALDTVVSDLAPASVAPPDLASAELETADLRLADQSTPDSFVPDSVFPDSVLPDSMIPDLPKSPTDTIDNTPKLALGSACSRDNQCGSSHCTNEVCCIVAKCTDTCDPSKAACPPYNGWTCAPYGTCRAY